MSFMLTQGLGVRPLKAQSLVYAIVKMYDGNADFFVASLLSPLGGGGV